MKIFKTVLASIIIATGFTGVVVAKPEPKQPKVFYSKGHPNLLKPTGKSGRYPVYAQLADQDLDDFRYSTDVGMYTVDQLMVVLPSIHPEDVNKNGIRCEFLCVDAKGQVIGWNPYRRL